MLVGYDGNPITHGGAVLKDWRSFKRWRLYLFLSLAVSLMLFILACGDDATPTSAPGATATATATSRPVPTPTATTAPRQPVQPRLRVVNPPPAEQFTMPHPQSAVSLKLIPIYEYLIGKDIFNSEQIPQLASSWSVEPDGKTWTFELTEGIPFIKNGKPTGSTVDIDDVFLSFDLQRGEAGNYPSKLSRNPGRCLDKVSAPDNWDVLGDR